MKCFKVLETEGYSGLGNNRADEISIIYDLTIICFPFSSTFTGSGMS